MPAPKGNANHLTHGVTAYLAIGRLPKGASYIRRLVGGLRTALERAVVDQFGEVNIIRAASIQTAARHEARCLLLGRYLRLADEPKSDDKESKTDHLKQQTITLSERLAILKEIGNATDARDRALARLGLADDGPGSDPWAQLDQQRQRDALTAPAVGDKTPAPLADTPAPPGEKSDTEHPNEPEGPQEGNTEPTGADTP